ncbi:MAG: biotin transporter BioY [bacterium]|nr:MAG: biotin transporter BioY [bacterium]
MHSQRIMVAGGSVGYSPASVGVQRAARIVSFLVFMFIGAQLAVRLPFTPVPVTMQTLFVILAGVTLGARDGLIAMISYLALGLSGVPLFAGFAFGPAVLLGPTGGYLLAFPVAAYLAGTVCERRGTGRALCLLTAWLGSAVILLSGTAHIALVTGSDFGNAAAIALLPFVAGELIKGVLVAAIAGRR